MDQILDNKKNDDLNNLDDEEILCNCNLCWMSRKIMLALPNNILFRNPFILFAIMFVLPIFFLSIIF
jgi:hypothetical protein